MIKDEWGIVQCTNCNKFNRIPGEEGDKNRDMLSLDDNKNHFEICAPYVYVIMTCPYCQSENKVRKEAEHVVCFKCHNSFSIQNPSVKVISSKRPVPLTGKTKRFSDVYNNLDQMRCYQNYIPQYQYFNVNNCQNCNNKTEALSHMMDKMQKPPPVKYQPPIDKLAPLKQLIRDMDEIDQKRTRIYDKGYRKGVEIKKLDTMMKEQNVITQDKSDNFLKRNHNLFPNHSMKPLGNAAYNLMFSPYQKKY